MISMEEIINKLESIISNIFNITIEELRDNRKLRSHTDARSILFYFLHVKYGISFYRLSKMMKNININIKDLDYSKMMKMMILNYLKI